MKKYLLAWAFFPLALFALEEKPWMGTCLEFVWKNDYSYSRYSRIQGAVPQLRSVTNDNILTSGLYIAPTSTIDTEVAVEFAATPVQNFSYRSSALQLRYLFLDDVLGDPVSFCVGVNIRAVSSKGLRDVSCPYHANGNIELTGSIGKEWDQGPYWFLRTYLLSGFGIGNRGFPWNHSKIALEGNYCDKHRFEVYGDGYFGFGHKKTVDPEHFYGYAKIHHESVNIGFAYRYLIRCWGMFSFEYDYRVFAKAFPENVNSFTIRYELPFSVL